ncbi:MAG: RNA methyltransferase [Bacteroidales bacterium]|nr:RNA methyltransferase [Bacteroidales bacterium]
MAVFRDHPSPLAAFLLRLEHAPETLQEEIIACLKPHITDDRLRKMEQVLSQRTQALTLLIENVYQPQNASAVLRTAEALGLQSVYIVEKDHRYEVSPQVVMGADKWLDLHYASSEATCGGNNTLAHYALLRRRGYRIAATCWTEDAVPIQELDLSTPIALAFGTELTGLSREAIEAADVRTYIPMYGFTQSFNISVAAALCMHYLRPAMAERHPELIPLQPQVYRRILVQWMAASLRLGEDLLKPYFQHPDLPPIPDWFAMKPSPASGQEYGQRPTIPSAL